MAHIPLQQGSKLKHVWAAHETLPSVLLSSFLHLLHRSIRGFCVGLQSCSHFMYPVYREGVFYVRKQAEELGDKCYALVPEEGKL